MKLATCVECGKIYQEIGLNEECWKELHDVMPKTEHGEMVILCDDCYLEFMDWYKTLTPDEKKKIREDCLKAILN